MPLSTTLDSLVQSELSERQEPTTTAHGRSGPMLMILKFAKTLLDVGSNVPVAGSLLAL